VVTEPALAKIEYVVERGMMPPARYVALHWDRSLGDAEEAAVLEFVRRHRGAHHATGKAAEPHATAALQPLPDPPKEDPAKVALGRKLYHDTRLSGDGTLSCASCHGLDKGGTDQVDVSTGIRGQKGPINSPTVFNSVYNIAQFWDGRAADLKAQAAGPVANPIEMGAEWDVVVTTLQADPALVAEVAAVYGGPVSQDNVTDAIAAFERTLVTPGAPFDRWLMGDASAMSEQAVRGYHLFVDNGCATCHVGKAIGGQSFELMGLRQPYFEGRDVKEVDRGRYNVTKDDRDLHRFKVPTLRNVELTYPYFHDASAKTLGEAVTVMARHQSPRAYTEAEAQDVVAFLEALTGTYEGRSLAEAPAP
jgi:cytochrome c peroxidase